MLDDLIYGMAITTAWSGTVYIIVMPIIFAVAKLKFKVWFDCIKIFKLSFIVAFCCYFIFTLMSIRVPFVIWYGGSGIDNMELFLIDTIVEMVLFFFGMILYTEIFYVIGRTVHKKIKTKKPK